LIALETNLNFNAPTRSQTAVVIMTQKFVFVSGNFFVLHPGHIRFLKFAAELAGKFTIGVRSTRPSDRYPTVEERIDALQSVGLADEVVEIESTLEHTLRRLRPDVVVKGREYQTVNNVESEILKEWGGELVFSSGESTYSGADFLEENHLSPHAFKFKRPSDFARRHDCDYDRIIAITEQFPNLKVVVVGDTIVDEYVTCEALGMSREDPTLVISPRQIDRFLGGAGIVAAHAAALGATTRFFSITGNDLISTFAYDQLKIHGVETYLVSDDSRPTTLKKRYRCEGKTLLRVSDLRQHEISGAIQQQLLAKLEPAITDADVLIFSDFNYGCLPQNFVEVCAAWGKKYDCVISADSQSSSQLGDISRFHGTHLVTPTEHELRVSLRDQVSGLSTLGKTLLERSRGHNALVTLGASGVLVVTQDRSADEADRVPALNRSPVDVSGAGDSLLVAATLTLAAKGNIYEAALLGSFAAAIQTSRLGNTPIQVEELQQVIH